MHRVRTIFPQSNLGRAAWRWTRRSFVTALVVILALIALLYWKQHAMLYHPRPYDARYAKFLPPDAVELRFTNFAGNQTAFYLPRGTAGRLPARIWVAVCGNGSLALDWTGLIAQDRRPGDAFLLIDYPGYAKSEGYANMATTRASADGALEALAQHLGVGERAIEPRLNTIGHSWGTAVALDFARRHPVKGVVLIAVFTDLREEAATVVGQPLSHLLTENYDNRAALRELTSRTPAPTVDIFHGTKDDIIPFRMGRELAELFPAFVKLHPVPGGDHLSPLFTATQEILAAMNR